ncbi:THUMP domain-containing protein 1 [Holothuria leucospilota]|uniref:THUMP domain-containing protein 1 n=1 Tax=Holothuria leucospilota TaxID=206669 RepID=A0A9Q1C1B1_HOLLE|nr:THUMP domain-containing protein 1 [Holothuria leucospilota]
MATSGETRVLKVARGMNVRLKKLLGVEKMLSDNDSDEGDIADALQREVSQMNQQRSEKNFRFQAVDSRAKNVIFIRTKIQDDPTTLVHHILMKLKELGRCQSKHIQRMLPISGTCRASLEDIEKTIKPLLEPYFHSPETKESTFAILFKARNNNQIRKGEVITIVANAVISNSTCTHKVDLDNPEYSILVEVICNVCCLSVLKDYNKLKKYNIRAIVGDEINQVRTNREQSASKEKECENKEQKIENISSETPPTEKIEEEEQDECKKQEKFEKVENSENVGGGDVRTEMQNRETERAVFEKEKPVDVSETGSTRTEEESKVEEVCNEDGIRIF